jgi:hypothetical protein
MTHFVADDVSVAVGKAGFTGAIAVHGGKEVR